MQRITKPITVGALRSIAKQGFGNLVKAVVDVKKEVVVIDAELHADQEALLLEQGSKQSDLWGINLYPDKTGSDFIEFDSLINLRPSQGNFGRGIDDETVRQQIINIVSQWIKEH